MKIYGHKCKACGYKTRFRKDEDGGRLDMAKKLLGYKGKKPIIINVPLHCGRKMVQLTKKEYNESYNSGQD